MLKMPVPITTATLSVLKEAMDGSFPSVDELLGGGGETFDVG